MRKNWIGALTLTAALLLLGGCSFSSPEDLYAVPRAAEDYKNLQEQIDKVRSAGAEYAGPLLGNYTQPIQLIDLDGDGVQEAVAFFRTTAADSAAPLQIYIYHQNAEGNYEVWNTISGDTPAINSIDYVDLDGKVGPNGYPDKELVVSWRLSDQLYLLGAYSVSGPETVELMTPVSYAEFALIDMDKDNQQEIVLLKIGINEKSEKVGTAEYYNYWDGEMVLSGSAPMSSGIKGLVGDSKPQSNYVRNGEIPEPALFVTSTLETGVITDIFALRNEKLVNITLAINNGEGKDDDEDDGTFSLNSSAAFRVRDINSDGYLEVPRPKALPNITGANSADFWSVRWTQYDLWGNATMVANTYFNGEDGWYLILPETWQGNIALSRQDNTNSGERGVLFYPYYPGEGGTGGTVGSEPFLAIYRLTGSNQTARAHAGSRFILLEQDDAIYAAEFFSNSGWDCGVDQEMLTGLFHLTF